MADCKVLVLLACLAALGAVHATSVILVPGLPVSGRMYLQTVTPSFAAGAGGTAPGGGGRRLLEAGPGRGLLQAAATNQSTAAGEAAIVIAGLNAVLSSNTGRKLLQTPGTGLEILAKLSYVGSRASVVLEIPNTAGNVAILTAATTTIPAAAPPAAFFNAEVALGSAVAVSKTGFLGASGGVVRVRLSFDLAGDALPPLQFSWQYATNLLAPQAAFFFANAAGIEVDPDKAGLPTVKGLVETLV